METKKVKPEQQYRKVQEPEGGRQARSAWPRKLRFHTPRQGSHRHRRLRVAHLDVMHLRLGCAKENVATGLKLA